MREGGSGGRRDMLIVCWKDFIKIGPEMREMTKIGFSPLYEELRNKMTITERRTKDSIR